MFEMSEGLHHGAIWPDESYSSDQSYSQPDESTSSASPSTHVPQATSVPSESPKKKGCLAALFGATFLSMFATAHPSVQEKETPAPELNSEKALTTLPKDVQELVKRRREKFL